MFTQLRKKSTTALALIAMASTLVVAQPAATHAAAGLTVPVGGTVAGGAGTLTQATFTISSFAVKNGQVVANGTLSGILTTASGAITILQSLSMPVQVGTATCDILHLDIGPISLNLLGLQVNLSEIVLDITAQSGAGNLLGNLLCAVAGLLDSPGGLARLLNQILGILG
jgi:hypothetical protein